MASRLSSSSSFAALASQQRGYIDYFFEHLDTGAAEDLIDAIDSCRGAVILSGVGKSGFIAERLGRMLLSIGIRAHYLSPMEALHGDLGLVEPGDLALFFSKSGSSDELLSLAPHVRRKGARLISIVCTDQPPLGRCSDGFVTLPLEKELCPFDLAPTTSSAAQLLFGDMCVVALMERRGFSEGEYGANHPAGAIGKELLLTVGDLMLKGEALPLVSPEAHLIDSLVTLSEKGCGCLLVEEDGQLVGIFTDGDLRRCIQSGLDLHSACLRDVMHARPTHITASARAVDALRLMQKVPGHFITELPVVGERGEVIGLIRMHQIVEQGIRA